MLSPPARLDCRLGFTLVELSIVLVILGLLVGGILSGQALIRAAELRSVSTDFSRYQAATMTFRDKYFAMPGDMTNAYAFWGTAAGCSNVNVSATSAGLRGCNGNGNGRTNTYMGGDGGDNYGSYEAWRAWQFMALAGLITGSYSGVNNPAAPTGGGSFTEFNSTIGLNVPSGKYPKLGYQLFYAAPGEVYYAAWIASVPQGQYVVAAADVPDGAGDREIDLEVLERDDAWNIDTKMDDGIPATGKVIGCNRAIYSACNRTSYPGVATTTKFWLWYNIQ